MSLRLLCLAASSRTVECLNFARNLLDDDIVTSSNCPIYRRNGARYYASYNFGCPQYITFFRTGFRLVIITFLYVQLFCTEVVIYLVEISYLFVYLLLCHHYRLAFPLSLLDGGLRLHMCTPLSDRLPVG